MIYLAHIRLYGIILDYKVLCTLDYMVLYCMVLYGIGIMKVLKYGINYKSSCPLFFVRPILCKKSSKFYLDL
jgi:hypothetical protein